MMRLVVIYAWIISKISLLSLIYRIKGYKNRLNLHIWVEKYHFEGDLQEREENLIITNSSIGMDSARVYTSVSKDAYTHIKSVNKMSAKDFMDSLSAAFGDAKSEIDNKQDEETKKTEDEADAFSQNGESSLDYLKGKFNEITTNKAASVSKMEEDLRSAIRYMLFNLLLMLLLGKNGGSEFKDEIMGKAFGTSSGSGNDILGLGNSIEFSKITDSVTLEHYEGEFEQTTFNAKGIVKTGDGRELDFNIDLTMSSSFEQYLKDEGVYESIGMKLIDPLIINYDTPAANISDQKFYFDLDADGEEDRMSMLGAGSGFLAYDKNEDGKITNDEIYNDGGHGAHVINPISKLIKLL